MCCYRSITVVIRADFATAFIEHNVYIDLYTHILDEMTITLQNHYSRLSQKSTSLLDEKFIE